MQAPHICVIYDGIRNPVFAGQVLAPVQKYLQEDVRHTAVLISFEYTSCSKADIYHLAQIERLQVIPLRKYLFLGSWSLYYAQRQVSAILNRFSSYHLIARGPIAGYISLQALSPTSCQSFIVQVRGLLAAEYEYAHRLYRYPGKINLFKKLRYFSYALFEKLVYNESYIQRYFPAIKLEVVSGALAEYLLDTYGIKGQRIMVANYDIPLLLPTAQRVVWRNQVRAELNIAPSATVFCYNGSLKPWQCPHETIEIFKHHYNLNANAYFLVLTHDKLAFETLLEHYLLPVTCYNVLTVPHQEIYRYLAACDVGIVWREKHLMNWISRPTKALEYRAGGLSILHNNTVAYLIENFSN
jgi:hypothetical protein